MSPVPYWLSADPQQDQVDTMMAPGTIQHPMHALVAPLSAPPPEISPAEAMGMSPKKPEEIPAEKPKVTKMSPLESREQDLEQGMTKRPEGFWQKLAHGAGMAGRIAGDIVAPGETELITKELGKEGIGPRANEFRQKEINELETQRSKQGLEGAQEEQAEANAGHLNAETPEVAPNAESARALQGAQVGNLESETRDRDAAAAQGPPLANAYAHAVNEALRAGKDPSQDPIVQHLADAITGIQKESAPKGLIQSQPIMGPDGKPHTYMLDSSTGQKVSDLGVHYEKPQVTNLNLERGQRNDLLKAYEPTLESAERMNVMTDAYEKAIKDHDQQAMLNLLANHLGMTMGLQKGSRLTKDIIHEAQESQPWLASIKAKFDKDGYLSGVTLSPNQMRQMVNLGQQRYIEDVKKSRSIGSYLGSKDDGPERMPGTATKNYYLGLANGDRTKAMQLMANDGWTVPNAR